MKWTLDKLPFARAPRDLHAHAGRLRADRLLRRRVRADARPARSPSATSSTASRSRARPTSCITGIPYISPYNVNSQGAQPAARAGDGARLLLSHVPEPAAPARRRRPDHRRTRARTSSIRCTTRATSSSSTALLPETRDAYTLEQKYQDEFAYNPSYIEMYRRGNAYHGAHPFYMWYWGQRGREKAGRVIVVGADNATVPELLGWETRRHARRGDRDGARHDGPQRADHDAAPPAHPDHRRDVMR